MKRLTIVVVLVLFAFASSDTIFAGKKRQAKILAKAEKRMRVLPKDEFKTGTVVYSLGDKVIYKGPCRYDTACFFSDVDVIYAPGEVVKDDGKNFTIEFEIPEENDSLRSNKFRLYRFFNFLDAEANLWHLIFSNDDVCATGQEVTKITARIEEGVNRGGCYVLSAFLEEGEVDEHGVYHK